MKYNVSGWSLEPISLLIMEEMSSAANFTHRFWHIWMLYLQFQLSISSEIFWLRVRKNPTHPGLSKDKIKQNLNNTFNYFIAKFEKYFWSS